MREITALIADDEATFRNFFSAVIERENLPVAALLEAGNGLEALTLALERDPDLVFLDIRMPGLDGLETAARLAERNFSGKVVIVSAHGEFDYARKALRSGVADYLLKPVKPADLAACIWKRVRECEQAAARRPGPIGNAPAIMAEGGAARMPAVVAAVTEYIAANLTGELRLEDIARAVHVSPWHLSRTFKRLTGGSIADCVREARLREAAKLLAESGRSVTEIAGMTGFDNAGYFATCFKRATGVSPSEFRKKYRRA